MNVRSLSRRSAFVTVAVGMALGASLLAPTGANAGTPTVPDTATATLLPTPLVDPNTNQFIPGTSTNVNASMNFSENGLLLSSSGTATGLNPNNQYVSLIYGLASNANVTLPITPPGPCVDDGTLGAVISQSPGNVIFSPVATIRMFQGLWFPPNPANGVANFSGNKSTDPATGIFLRQGNTVSIRQATLALDPAFLFTDIRPQVFVIQACGVINPNNYVKSP